MAAFELTGGGGIISDTHANIAALKLAGTLQNSFYMVTNPAQASRIIILSEFGNTLATEGFGLFTNADFQGNGDYSGVVTQTGIATGTLQFQWLATNEGAYVTGDIVIFNCRHFQVINSAALNGTDPTVNTTAYSSVLPTTAAGCGYILEWDEIKYDFDNDVITSREDWRVNKVAGASIPFFQWGNNAVAGNTVITQSGFDNLNNSGVMIANEAYGNSAVDARFNQSVIAANRFDGQSQTVLRTNAGVVSVCVFSGSAQISLDNNTGIVANCNFINSAQAVFTNNSGVIANTNFATAAQVLGTNFAGTLSGCQIDGQVDITNAVASFVFQNCEVNDLSTLVATAADGVVNQVFLQWSLLNIPTQQAGAVIQNIVLNSTGFDSVNNQGIIQNLYITDSQVSDTGGTGFAGNMTDSRYNNCQIVFDDSTALIIDNDFNECQIDWTSTSGIYADNSGDFGQAYFANATGIWQQSYLGRGTNLKADVAYSGVTTQLIMDSGSSVDMSSSAGTLSQLEVNTAALLDVSTLSATGAVSLCKFTTLSASLCSGDGDVIGMIVEQDSSFNALGSTVTGLIQYCTVSNSSVLNAPSNSLDIGFCSVTEVSSAFVSINSGTFAYNKISCGTAVTAGNNSGNILLCEFTDAGANMLFNAGNINGVIMKNCGATITRGAGFFLSLCRFEDFLVTMTIPPFESFANEKLVRGESTFKDIFPIWNQGIPAIILTEKEYAGVIKILQSDEMLVTGVTGTFLTGETVSAPGGYSAKIAINPAFTPGSIILVNVAGVATPTDTLTGDFSGATAIIGISSTLDTQSYPLLTGMDGNHPVRFYADPDIPSNPTIVGTAVAGAGLNQIVLEGASVFLKNSAAKPDFITIELDKTTLVNGQTGGAIYV